MEDYKNAVKAYFKKFGAETLDLLRKNNFLAIIVQRKLSEEACAKLSIPTSLINESLEQHCKMEKISTNTELNEWLNNHCLRREELIHQLSLPIKLSKLALDCFEIQAESRFLQRKEELDQVIYSLVRVKDSGIAYELYLQLEANEANFETLASDHSEGPEQRSGGKVGPGSLKRAHPRLQQLLRTATPGVVQEPILIEQWWVVARLEERQEASFDDAMRQRMASELLQDWLTSETKAVVKSLLSAENGISML